MKRIDTSTVDEDLFGTGRDGFTNGDPDTAVPPTQLDDSWFNNAQEELCRCVEGDGTTLDEDNYHQVDDAVQRAAVRGSCTNPNADYVLRGLQFNISGTSLTVSLGEGEFVENARRYVITDAKLLAAGFNSFLLTASRDTYFYIASVNPGVITPGAPNRETVYITTVAVTNGASQPSTPAGTLLFARVVTSGSDATTVTYFNRGPRLVAESQASVVLRPVAGTDVRTALMPGSTSPVDLGATAPDSNSGFFTDTYFESVHIRSGVSSVFTYADNYRYTVITQTAAGAVAQVNIVDSDDYPEGTTAYIEVRGVAFCPGDPTIDSYSFRKEFHIHKNVTWNLDATGGAPDFQNSPAGGIDSNVNISSDNARITLTGHTTEALRWFLEIHVLIAGD